MNLKAPTSTPRGRRFLLAGCIVLILTGLAHLATHLVEPPAPKSDDEAQLLRLMSSVKIDAAGTPLTIDQILGGFGLYFSLSSISLGAVVIALSRNAEATRRASVLMLTFAATATIISIRHFPSPPVMFFAAAGAMFLLAAIRAVVLPRAS